MQDTIPAPCPFLPVPEREYTVEDIQALGRDRSQAFYDTALKYAQSFWFRGFPAKTLLLINRALACCLPEVSLCEPAKPYHAVAWVLLNSPGEKFMGNPRRHYQHLATRMVEPHKELRTWRAWACWYLAKHLLDPAEHPADAKQIREEGVVEPTFAQISANLLRLSPANDDLAWKEALIWAAAESRRPLSSGVAALDIREIQPPAAEMAEVQRLAHRIWPESYAGIISQEQIDYMLSRWYDLEYLQRDMAEEGVRYALLYVDDEAVGYVAWSLPREDRSIFLHKLYVLPEMHGRGIGARTLEWLVGRVQSEHNQPSAIRLRVNRNNHQAIRAYLRQGFVFEEDVCTPIGEGYVMDDHVMVKGLG